MQKEPYRRSPIQDVSGIRCRELYAHNFDKNAPNQICNARSRLLTDTRSRFSFQMHVLDGLITNCAKTVDELAVCLEKARAMRETTFSANKDNDQARAAATRIGEVRPCARVRHALGSLGTGTVGRAWRERKRTSSSRVLLGKFNSIPRVSRARCVNRNRAKRSCSIGVTSGDLAGAPSRQQF